MGAVIVAGVCDDTSLSESGIKELPGKLSKRDEYSGPSKESDLNDEEDDGGGLSCCSIARSASADTCLEKSSGNKVLTSV